MKSRNILIAAVAVCLSFAVGALAQDASSLSSIPTERLLLLRQVTEEAAQVAPQLVVFDKDGAPQTVRYHFVNAMLLNEVQKQRQMIEEHQRANEKQLQLVEAQQSTIARQQEEIQDLAARLAKLEALVALVPLGR